MLSEDELIEARHKLAAGRIVATREMPYFTTALMAMTPHERPGLGTFAVDLRWRMYYDPAICLKWTIKEIAAAWLHEVGHVVRDHNARFASLDGSGHNPQLFNAAADAAINSDLRESNIVLADPDKRYYAEPNPQFPKWKRNMTAEEMYFSAGGGSSDNSGNNGDNGDDSDDSEGDSKQEQPDSQNQSDSDENEDNESPESDSPSDSNDNEDEDTGDESDNSSSSENEESEDSTPDDSDNESGDGKSDSESEDSDQDGDSESSDGDSGEDEDSEKVDGDSDQEGDSKQSTGDSDKDEDSEQSDGDSDSDKEGNGDSDSDQEGDGDSGENESDSSKGGSSENGDPSDSSSNSGEPSNSKEMPDCGSAVDGMPRDYEEEDEDDGSVDETTAESLKKETARAIVDYGRSNPGKVPGNLIREAENILNPQVDWRDEFAAMIRHVTAKHSGYSNYSYQRPSRRSSGSNFILPTMRNPPAPEIAIILDTSGSMDVKKELAMGLAEMEDIINRSAKYSESQSIKIINCDASASVVEVVRDLKDFTIVGGGGTDMRIGLKAASELKPKVDIILTITDGYTPWPKTIPEANEQAQYIALIVGRKETTGNMGVPPWMKTVVVSIPDKRKGKKF